MGESKQLLRIGGVTDAEVASFAADQKLRETQSIRAPMDGVVLDLMAVVGAKLEEMAPLYRVANLNTLWLDIQVPQAALGTIRPGMKVAVADCVIQFPAEITAIGRVVNPTTQSVSVRAALVDPRHRLRPGQFVSVQIVTEQGDTSSVPVWAVPARALVRNGKRSYLFVEREGGFEAREVHPVGADRDQTYITDGLSAETKFVVSGVAALKALWSSQDEAGA